MTGYKKLQKKYEQLQKQLQTTTNNYKLQETYETLQTTTKQTLLPCEDL